MSGFLYHRPSDRIAGGTWSISTGTARTDYGVANVEDSDPSNPFWANETTIRIVCDLGSAIQVDRVYLFGHNLTNSSVPKVQLHTANSWATPDASVTITVPTAYPDGFAYNVVADFAANYNAAGRTKQYLSVVNTVANSATVYIGEVWIVGSSRSFTQQPRYGFVQGRTRITNEWQSKKGVQTVYDYGGVSRRVKLEFPATYANHNDLRDWESSARGPSRGFPIVLYDGHAEARLAEPWYVRFATSPTEGTYEEAHAPTPVEFEELGQGQVLGA